MTEALKTHIAMLPELPEGFAWEVGEPEWRYGSRKADPAFVAITYWIEPGPWKLPDKMPHSSYIDDFVLPYDEEFYEYALKLENGTLRMCKRNDATHYRDNGKRVAKSAPLTDLWTPDELVSVAKDLHELWQIRLAQRGLYGVYPSKA